MTEPTSAATFACAVASGTFTVTCLSTMGINPPEMVAGLLGCIAAQALLSARMPELAAPEAPRPTFRKVMALTIGSVLLASLLGPLAAPWFVDSFGSWAPKVASESVRAAVSGIIGAFAQTILTWIGKQVSRLPGVSSKENPNA